MSTSNQMNIPAEVFTEEEKDSIIKDQYQDSIKSRRVEAVLVNGEIFSAKPPFFSGWASGTAGHWGVIVDGMLHHLVFKMDEDRRPVAVEFERENFKERWINEGKADRVGLVKLKRCLIKHQTERLKLKVKLKEVKLTQTDSNIKHLSSNIFSSIPRLRLCLQLDNFGYL